MLQMAVRQVLVNASPDDVWAVLSDGWSYAEWVVGTTEVRDVDETWPAVGSKLHYTIGRAPLRIENHSTVRVLEPGRRIELEAHAPPVGSARVAVQLIPWGEETLVIFDEHPLRGAGARLHSALLEVGVHLRTRRMLTNLARVVERRGGRESVVMARRRRARGEVGPKDR